MSDTLDKLNAANADNNDRVAAERALALLTEADGQLALLEANNGGSRAACAALARARGLADRAADALADAVVALNLDDGDDLDDEEGA